MPERPSFNPDWLKEQAERDRQFSESQAAKERERLEAEPDLHPRELARHKEARLAGRERLQTLATEMKELVRDQEHDPESRAIALDLLRNLDPIRRRLEAAENPPPEK